jgi:two-component sensor histidine kinase
VQRLLVRELHHRVKNSLATVQAIMGTTMRFSSSMEDFQEAFVGRVAALSKTHSLLTDDKGQVVDFRVKTTESPSQAASLSLFQLGVS